jgi:ketosteroid isomerase-like protein
MAEDDIAIVQRALEAFNRGGIEATAEFGHPELEFQGAGLVLPREPMRGLEQAIAQLRMYQANFEHLRYTPLEFLRCGDAVVVPAHFTGKGPSGAELQLVLTLAFWLREGKIARVRIFMSREAALKELPEPVTAEA